MDSPQSVTEIQSKEAGGCNGESAIGVLDVFVHQARDIQNICIYHKQDVYAKICLTSDPDRSVSTKIINGGGINPVFNDNLKLNVPTVESSLKCEVWMLSRVKNYLEDQLLGFALIPLSEIIIKNGNMIEKEFCLSSTDLFHSPSGFVRLSIAYAGAGTGACSELVSIPAAVTGNESEILKESELDKIEFPDPKVVNENQMMVSEYYGYTGLESETPVENDNDDEDNQIVGVNLVESFSNVGSPPGSVSINGSDSNLECVSKENRGEEEEAESNGSSSTAAVTAAEGVKIVAVPESKMVQQDIVDMYMKSMQQFTESLAKMKLPPVDLENGSSDSGKTAAATKTPGSKVFYGSRAFF